MGKKQVARRYKGKDPAGPSQPPPPPERATEGEDSEGEDPHLEEFVQEEELELLRLAGGDPVVKRKRGEMSPKDWAEGLIERTVKNERHVDVPQVTPNDPQFLARVRAQGLNYFLDRNPGYNLQLVREFYRKY